MRDAADPRDVRLVLASNNRAKLVELGAPFAPLAIELVAQAELGIDEADEPQPTAHVQGDASCSQRRRPDFPVLVAWKLYAKASGGENSDLEKRARGREEARHCPVCGH